MNFLSVSFSTCFKTPIQSKKPLLDDFLQFDQQTQLYAQMNSFACLSNQKVQYKQRHGVLKVKYLLCHVENRENVQTILTPIFFRAPHSQAIASIVLLVAGIGVCLAGEGRVVEEAVALAVVRLPAVQQRTAEHKRVARSGPHLSG